MIKIDNTSLLLRSFLWIPSLRFYFLFMAATKWGLFDLLAFDLRHRNLPQRLSRCHVKWVCNWKKLIYPPSTYKSIQMHACAVGIYLLSYSWCSSGFFLSQLIARWNHYMWMLYYAWRKYPLEILWILQKKEMKWINQRNLSCCLYYKKTLSWKTPWFPWYSWYDRSNMAVNLHSI